MSDGREDVNEMEARQVDEVDRLRLSSLHLVDTFLIWSLQAQENTVASQEVDLHDQDNNPNISLYYRPNSTSKPKVNEMKKAHLQNPLFRLLPRPPNPLPPTRRNLGPILLPHLRVPKIALLDPLIQIPMHRREQIVQRHARRILRVHVDVPW